MQTSNVPRKAQPKASCSLPPHHAQSLVVVSCFRVAFQDECYHEIKSCGNEQTIGGLCQGSIAGCEDGDLATLRTGPSRFLTTMFNLHVGMTVCHIAFQTTIGFLKQMQCRFTLPQQHNQLAC